MSTKQCFIGFDGFIDLLCHVVKAQTVNGSCFYNDMRSFGSDIIQAADKSANFELVATTKKLGGNAMILASALQTLDYDVSWAATVGRHENPTELHPVFASICQKTKRWVNLGSAGSTQALEFSNGKLLMGLQGKISNLKLEDLEEVMGKNWVEEWLWPCDLIAPVNWTMTPHMGSIWAHMAKIGFKNSPLVFVDIADPKKRDPKELERDLKLLLEFKRADVVLGLNRSEAHQVAKLFGYEPPHSCENLFEQMACFIREKLPLFAVVIHDRYSCAISGGYIHLQIENQAAIEPKVATGAGDHFNAGLIHGLLEGLSLEDALGFASQYSRTFVEKAQSPTSCDCPLPATTYPRYKR